MSHTAQEVLAVFFAILASGYGSLRCTPEPVVLFEVPVGVCSGEAGCLAEAGGSAGSANAGGQLGGGRPDGAGGLLQGAGGYDGESPEASQEEAGTGSTVTCRDDLDCPGSSVCFKCGDALGSCGQPPSSCEPEGDPVCGCDHVTYWTDCWRKLSRAGTSTKGECTTAALRCSPTAPCTMAGGYCARPISTTADCTPDVQGTCWVMPSTCPSTPSAVSLLAKSYLLCDDGSHGFRRGPPFGGSYPDGGFSGPEQPTCTSICEAIKTEQVYRQLDTDQCPSRP